MNSKRYWYELLNHYERKRHFQNGLTIPFIIGSRSIIEPEKKLQTVRELFQDILISPYYISVLTCIWLGEYVFSLSDKETKEIYGGFDKIVIIDGSFNYAKNIDDIINEIDMRYLDKISKKHYSKIDGEWQKFSDHEDMPRLLEVKGRFFY